MKLLLGALYLAAGHAITVNAFVIPSLFSLAAQSAGGATPVSPGSFGLLRRFLDRELAARQASASDDSLNLSTVFGTASFGGPSQTPTIVSTPTSLMTDSNSVISLSTEIPPQQSESDSTIVTVTVTAIAIVTDASTTDPSPTAPQLAVQGNEFGGSVGQIFASNAFTGGALVTVGGQDAFGGAVGAVNVDATVTSTAFVSTTVVLSTPIAVADPPATSILSALQGTGAFGGVVGDQAASSATVTSIANAFQGIGAFGGVVGDEVASSATAVYAGAIDVSISLELDSVVSTDISSSSTSDVIVYVTTTTVINPIVTMSQTVDAVSIESANADPSNSGAQTTTATVTSTFTISNAAATPLPNITLAEIFPACANQTGNIPALASITIPDIVLPSNLTLAQVLGFFGGATDCSELIQLLGISNSTSGITKREFRTNRRFKRNYKRQS